MATDNGLQRLWVLLEMWETVGKIGDLIKT
jgi:hypothetical protein